MNNHPLKYIEDYIQYPVLTLNNMILGREKTILEENPELWLGRKQRTSIKILDYLMDGI